MNTMRQRGSTLVIAMLLLLIMMGLAVNMAFNAQAQSALTSGVKLQQFYETAAYNAFNKARATLPDYWTDVSIIEAGPDEDYKWRFGELLELASQNEENEYGNFPDNEVIDNITEMNSGMLELTYKIWVNNNPDDPGVILNNIKVDEVTFNENWDLDGRIVLTVEVFSPTDQDNPVATQSAIVAPAGGEYVGLYDDAVFEGDASDVGGQGTGTLGEATEIEIDSMSGDGD